MLNQVKEKKSELDLFLVLVLILAYKVAKTILSKSESYSIKSYLDSNTRVPNNPLAKEFWTIFGGLQHTLADLVLLPGT
jgi:hypothetical protein